MDLETTQTTTTTKLPILKQGEYDIWRLRIEQYFQVQDYALWDVIENGNSFKPIAQTTTHADGTSTSLIPDLVTIEEKAQKKNDVKARSMLLDGDIVEQEVKELQSQAQVLQNRSQPNGSQFVYEDLEQIHEDDIEEMDLKWDISITEHEDKKGHPQKEDQGYVDNGYSRHMTGNMSYLSDFKEFDRGYVTFGGGAKGGKITGKGTLKTGFLHMELFGLTFMSSLMNKKYCQVVTDDYSTFTWVFFLATKDETSGILKRFITEIENLVDKKALKGNFSVAEPPQQNDVAERRNRTLIEAARTMLADSKLPTTFWAEAVNSACYVAKIGQSFDGKSDEGFFVGYLLNSKAFKVYNIRTRKVEENLHIRFLEDKPIIAGDGLKWLFDIDVLTKSMNYVPVVVGTNSNDLVGTKESIGTGYSSKETGSSQDYILMPLWKDGSLFDYSLKNASNDEPQPSSNAGKKDDEGVYKESEIVNQEKPKNNT
ncbi:putative ribonuclease H-like domain-containing protein [Tanacetum coccineum]